MGAASADPGGMQRGLREIPADAAGAGAEVRNCAKITCLFVQFVRTGICRLSDISDFCGFGTKPDVKL